MINRRRFLYVVAVGLVLAIIPNTAVADIQPIPGKKRKFSDRNWVCRSYMCRPLTEDKTKKQGCQKCLYEASCLYSGTRFQFDTKKTRTFMPEMWDKKYQNDFVN